MDLPMVHLPEAPLLCLVLGLMEKNMETIIMGLKALGLGFIGIIVGDCYRILVL